MRCILPMRSGAMVYGMSRRKCMLAEDEERRSDAIHLASRYGISMLGS
jgi:hypothetical protein